MAFCYDLEILVQDAGCRFVNGTYVRCQPSNDQILISYSSDCLRYGLDLCLAMDGCPAGWYITRRGGEEGLYFNEGSVAVKGVPTSGWKVYTGSFSNPGQEPAPSVAPAPARRLVTMPVAVSGAGTDSVNGIYCPQQSPRGWKWVHERLPHFIISWYADYQGQPPRYYLSDRDLDEQALYCGDVESLGELPKQWQVYTGPESAPGASPAPSVTPDTSMPYIFSNPVTVHGAGSAQVNGIYVPVYDRGGWGFVKDDDSRYIMFWYPAYEGERPGYYISDVGFAELALYYGESPCREELPDTWCLYEGEDSAPSSLPAPRVRPSELFVAAVSLLPQSTGGEVCHCTSPGGRVITEVAKGAREATMVQLGDVREAVAKAIGRPVAVVRLVAAGATRLLCGADHDTVAHALGGCHFTHGEASSTVNQASLGNGLKDLQRCTLPSMATKNAEEEWLAANDVAAKVAQAVAPLEFPKWTGGDEPRWTVVTQGKQLSAAIDLPGVPGCRSTLLDISKDALRLVATTAVGPLPLDHTWEFKLNIAFGCEIDLNAVQASFSKTKGALIVRALIVDG